MRVHQQPAYVLLNRPYSETSWIVEAFSRDYGRIALMAKGARRIKSRWKGVLLPFQPLLLSWTGRGEIPTMTSAELAPSELNLFEQELRRDRLVCGFYCNELLVYLLHRHDPHPQLFDGYHDTMMQLYERPEVADDPGLGALLREFEHVIIRESGYEVNFVTEAGSKTPIDSEADYLFEAGHGFVRRPPGARTVSGTTILGLRTASAGNDFDPSQGKRLMRDILRQMLGYKTINSREMFFPRSREHPVADSQAWHQE